MRFEDEQAASTIRYDDGTVLTKCDFCQRDYAERKPPGEPPCHSCRVWLMVENEDAAKVFMMVRYQTVQEHTAKGIITDLSIPAVKIAMDLCGVRNQLDCMERIRQTWYELRENRNAG